MNEGIRSVRFRRTYNIWLGSPDVSEHGRGRRALAAASLLACGMAALTVLSPPVGAQDDPTAPTGRAVCNLAFTATAAISFGSASAPPDAPLGPNDIVVALTPLLRTCADRYPTGPARRCVTSDLYPRTGLPVVPPDPAGIATSQAESAVAAADPLGLALSGPLREAFAEALACRDPGDRDEEALPPLPADPSGEPLASPSAPVEPAVRSTVPSAGDPPSPAVASTRAPLPDAASTQSAPAAPLAALVSRVPAPLRGPAVAFSGLVVAGLGVALQRQLDPRRRASLLDSVPGGSR